MRKTSEEPRWARSPVYHSAQQRERAWLPAHAGRFQLRQDNREGGKRVDEVIKNRNK